MNVAYMPIIKRSEFSKGTLFCNGQKIEIKSASMEEVNGEIEISVSSVHIIGNVKENPDLIGEANNG